MATTKIMEVVGKEKTQTKVEPFEVSLSHKTTSDIYLVQKDEVNQNSRQDWLVVYDKPVGRHAHLPPLGWESGYREVYNEQTGKVIRTPITLSDILHPLEEDLGVVKVAQSVDHSDWVNDLSQIIKSYLDESRAEEEWLTLQDVIIYWENREDKPRAPDIMAIPGGKRPKPPNQSYRVGKQGPVPSFVVEITSTETRSTDLNTKPTEYAARGIQEYLIIDIKTPISKGWRLIGYVLEQNGTPYYRPLIPDEEGGITFENLPFRFVPIGRERIDVYDTQTGEPLLNLFKMRQLAKSEMERADAETERADAVQEQLEVEIEARRALEEELALLRAQLGQKET